MLTTRKHLCFYLSYGIFRGLTLCFNRSYSTHMEAEVNKDRLRLIKIGQVRPG